MPKSEAARLDALADPSSLGDLDADDPKSVGRWMRKMGREMGDDLGGEDLDEMIDEIEGGGDPATTSSSDTRIASSVLGSAGLRRPSR